MALEEIKEFDSELHDAMKQELSRQRKSIELIPSENFASARVLAASGSVLTNKYSEGYPGKRYYGGNEFIDKVERLAIERAKALFGVPHANVQPYSGSPANFAIYFSICNPGDTIMGQNLTDGGHLTHGWKTSMSGQIFKSVPYHVTQAGYIDIEEARSLAEANRPRLIWIGASAYPRALPFKEFSEIADSVGAYLVADISHIAGLVVAGMHESPAKYVHIIMTTTQKTMRGPRGAIIMATKKGLEKDPELADKIDKTVFPGMQGGPHDHTTAAMAIAFKEAMSQEFKDYAKQMLLNSKALAEAMKKRGFKLVTDGTDNHMVLVDLTNYGKGFGVFAQDALDSIGITVNKNTIPKDPSSPFYPSGIRMGTPAVTTRGMKEAQMSEIAELISMCISEVKDSKLPENKDERQEYLKSFKKSLEENKALENLREKVMALCERFPLYPGLEY
ncbi:MAG: Glycine hydroxymethyltransferase [Candidatus Micrarchaeum acidiphilum ARMAN-2]|uniref:Serine hydroxymethyltransferase n=1 Tax=Candidatus Micrarchaeum acidiphilum ARMAN-2 TaxID=425595 RepID=C7DIJ0_MICA2|nr:MAG: Glycine hydroxymethyltransferase [Candidatus Micrarchaeum acidiphilum ARMAN-2]